MTENKFVTVRQLSEIHNCFSESSLRYLIFNSRNRKDGFDACLRRVGRKILINLSKFEDWLDSHREVHNG